MSDLRAAGPAAISSAAFYHRLEATSRQPVGGAFGETNDVMVDALRKIGIARAAPAPDGRRRDPLATPTTW